jgi:hypothetical protein
VRRTPIAIATTVALAGCGNDRTAPPDIGRIPAPAAFRDAKYAQAGVFFRAPTNWRIIDGTEPLPETLDQLGAARDALVAQVKQRDATFKLSSSRLVLKPGLRAVELVGSGTNQGRKRRVRSLHAYGDGAEVIVDAFAPPKVFSRVDKQTFARVARSLKLRAPRS